jgi:hypothetical protein
MLHFSLLLLSKIFFTPANINAVGIETRPGAERARVRIPVQATHFSLRQNAQPSYETHSASYSTDTAFLCRG